MRYRTCQEIRELWVKFFTQRSSGLEHQYYPSASLVPDNPTLLLNSAGMVPFVPIFLGTRPVPNPPRIVSVQKCVRVGGKDSDLENIGRTNRHHSFFEMLGNFSFGNYFKKEAITMAWDFVTKELELEPSRLCVSVFAGDAYNAFDKEAYEIWDEIFAKEFSGQNYQERIWKLGSKDNFWGPPGKTGPCGPCSEIYYDRGEHILDKDDRFVEIWNLVFMELEKSEQGDFSPLSSKNIDTGAGLERLASIVQSKNNSFETDELWQIMQALSHLTQIPYGANQAQDLYLKIIADHLRCLAFLIADGIRPTNIGRGYILRMIIRRAARFLYLLRNVTEAGLYTLIPDFVKAYSQAYPYLLEQESNIQAICKKEEEQFLKTIIAGLDMLESKLKSETVEILSGDFVFDLYSTYGFPVELTEEIAKEHGLKIDLDAYEKAKEKHSQISNTGVFDKSIGSKAYINQVLTQSGTTQFIGYDTLIVESKLLAIVDNEGSLLDQVESETQIQLILDQSPFYAESGGQVSDKGFIDSDTFSFEVESVKNIEGVFVHFGKLQGKASLGQKVKASVDKVLRDQTTKHHTSCHLLQAALRQILGSQVRQMGSLVCPDYTRFDFNFERAMTSEEIQNLETLINTWIQSGFPVKTQIMDLDKAMALGALSFFEEKYSDQVRVLLIGDDRETPSIELCGGTHVRNLQEISKIVIAQESSVASGIRRIRLLASNQADEYLKEQMKKKEELQIAEAAKRASQEALKEQRKILNKLIREEIDSLLKLAQPKKGFAIFVSKISQFFDFALDIELLKVLSEALLIKMEDKYSAAVILLASVSDGKITFVSTVSDSLTKEYNASDLVKKAANLCGGSGGGKANFAQAGAKDVNKLDQALDSVLFSFAAL